jgi:hypothetical protein
MSVLEETAAPEAVLTDAERERLAQLERTVETGLDAAVAAGRALRAIRDEQLWRQHATFKAYLRIRFGRSQSYSYALLYIGQVADVLEGAGESPAGAGAALRELVPILHQHGEEAVVAAYRAAAMNGKLPTAAETRRRLVDAGLVDKPVRAPADTFKRRLTSLERVVPTLEPHPMLGELLRDYALRTSVVAERLHALAEEALPPSVPPGALCLRHGARRDGRGICKDCRRPDLSDNARAGAVAA